MTISETMARLRARNEGWQFEHVETRHVPWLAIRLSSDLWIGGHPVAEAQGPDELERLMGQAVDLTALPSAATGLPGGNHMAQLTFLRGRFPGWAFELGSVRPVWRAQRNYLDYAKPPAAITELRGNDPSELALLLMRVPKAER